MTPAVQVAFLRLDFVWTFEPLAVWRGKWQNKSWEMGFGKQNKIKKQETKADW